jgi:hypothetical protein
MYVAFADRRYPGMMKPPSNLRARVMSTTTNPLPPAITKRTPNLENKVLATKLHHSATKKQNFIKSESKKSKKRVVSPAGN